MTKAEADRGYVELHANSAFSFLEAASLPEALVHAAFEADLPAMALLDRNGFYGSPRFHTQAAMNKIKAHVGAEIAVPGLQLRATPSAALPHQHQPEPSRIPLLCIDQAGYQNLCQMITRFKMRQPGKCEGFAEIDDLREFHSGLLCMTGGDEGPLWSALHRGGEPEGRRTVEELTRIFGRDNVYVELQRHGNRHKEACNQAALRIAESLRLPVVATNGVRYATPYEREVLDVFTGIRHGCSLDAAGRLLQQNSQRHVRSAAQMRRLFADIPEAIDNTLLVSQRLQFELHNLGYKFPTYDTPNDELTDACLPAQTRRRGHSKPLRPQARRGPDGAREEAGRSRVEADRAPRF